MSWEHLKSLIMQEYCPPGGGGEVQKLEQELWGITMTGTDILSYSNMFSDLVILCIGMVPLERKKV